MKIKKFNCISCGAPKINPYTSPYIVCDFCGTFTDVDFEQGLDAWNKDPNKTEKYTKGKLKYESTLAELLGKDKKVEYKKVQLEYWDFYYKSYPEYLPPTITTDEKYKMYLDICADVSTVYAFDPNWAKKTGEQALLQQGVTYNAENGKTYADTIPFFKLTDFFINYVKEANADFYANPDYKIMLELLPPNVHFKMKMSMYVQAWIPYLREKDVQKLLQQTNFTTEFIDVQPVNGKHQSCQFCQQDIFVPDGSYKVNCEHCLKVNTVQNVFHCISCGTENPVPENPAKPINCVSCGTENRLIKGWF
ncbi:MAG: hypothetical protein U0U67_17610 [Chitinophagales bacterium]